MKAFFPLVLLILVSCSHKRQENPEQRITTFVEEYSGQFQALRPENQSYVASYEEYLNSVRTIFADLKEEKNFDLYLESLKTNGDYISKTEAALPTLYLKDKKKVADVKSKDFQLYKTNVLTELHDKLTQERTEKLRQAFGEATFSKLMENNQKFESKFPL